MRLLISPYTTEFFREALATVGANIVKVKGVDTVKPHGLNSLFQALYANDATPIPESIAAILSATRADKAKQKGEAITTEGRYKASWASTLSQMNTQVAAATPPEGAGEGDTPKDCMARVAQLKRNLPLLLTNTDQDTVIHPHDDAINTPNAVRQ